MVGDVIATLVNCAEAESGFPCLQEVKVSEEVTRAHGTAFFSIHDERTTVVEPSAEAVVGILVVGANTELESEVFVGRLMRHAQLRAFECRSFDTSDGTIKQDGVIPGEVIAQSAVGFEAFQARSGTPLFPVHEASELCFHFERACAVGHDHAHRSGAIFIFPHASTIGHVVFTSEEVEHAHAMLVGVVVTSLPISKSCGSGHSTNRVLTTCHKRVVHTCGGHLRQEVKLTIFSEDVRTKQCRDGIVRCTGGRLVA